MSSKEYKASLKERIDEILRKQKENKTPQTAVTKRYLETLKKYNIDAALPSPGMTMEELCDFLDKRHKDKAVDVKTD